MESHTQSSPRLSALIVGREAGSFALSCARSLRRGWSEAGRPDDALEVIVVDNASRSDQGHWFDLLRGEGARILIQEHDLGFAGGVELAYAASRGGEDDLVAILRPEVFFPPGSVRELVRYLELHPEVGAVAPRGCVDEQGLLQQPPVEPFGVRSEIGALLSRLSPWLGRRYAARRTRRAQALWDAQAPAPARELDGSCLVLPRVVAQKLAGLMDRRFIGGLGDADLCRRLRASGMELVRHSGARVLVHRGPAVNGQESSERRRAIARSAFLERWSSRGGRRALRALERLVARWPESRLDRPLHDHVAVKGPQPIELRLPGRRTWWLELSRDPAFRHPLATGGEGERWRLPRQSWDWLQEGRWYARAIEPDTGRVVRAWTFVKSEPARAAALEVAPSWRAERHWPAEAFRPTPDALMGSWLAHAS